MAIDDDKLPLNEDYEAGFISMLDASQAGEVVQIPHPLDKVGEVFNLMPSRYTLISGSTGSGKTSYADFCHVLAPWSFLQKNDMDIHWEVNYFSLERKRLFKHAKWVSWMIYRDNTDLLLSADQILGWKNGPINSEGYKLIRSYDEEMSELLDHVTIYDGKVGVKAIEEIIEERAHSLGTLFKADEHGVFQGTMPVYIEKFDEKNLVETTRRGDKRPYIELEWEGQKFRLNKHGHRYFPIHPRQFVFFLIDGINLLGKGEVLSAISIVLANARDLYGFSPIVITQQNRAMGDITRMKIHGADLSPQLEDIFASSQMGFDADIVIGLFDPYKYKAWDKEGKYGGYCINPMDSISTPSMQTPNGINRFRSMHILKNTFGADGNKFGMKFLGEYNHFQTLPFPDSAEMEVIYSDIRKGV